MARSTLARDYDIGRTLNRLQADVAALKRRMLGLAYLTPEFTAVQACKVTRNADLTIPHTTTVTLAFNDEVFDDTGMHDNAVDNSRITMNVAGYYTFGFNFEMESALYTRFLVTVVVNSADDILRIQMPATTNTAPQRFAGSMMHQFAAGDYIEVQLFQQNAAAAARDLVVTDYSPIFYAARIGS